MYRDSFSLDIGHPDGHGETGLPGTVGVVVGPLVVVGSLQGQPAPSNIDRHSGDWSPVAALHMSSELSVNTPHCLTACWEILT